MLIGLKYCGGCNPNYERREIAERARREFSGVVFQPYSKEGRYDLVLVVCGCLEECFTFSCVNSIYGTIFVHSEREYRRLREFLEQHYHDGKQ